MQRMLVVLALVVWPLASWGQDAGGSTLGSADAAAIRSVIERQLAAFQRDDDAAAFAFAAPAIQAIFGTAEAFMEMVRRGYAPVYRPRGTEFASLVVTADGPVQKVLFAGPDGRLVLALYCMEREPDGSWRISGCVLVKPEERTT